MEQVAAGISARLQSVETRLQQVEQSVAGNSARLQTLETRLQQVEQVLSAKMDEILSRMPKA